MIPFFLLGICRRVGLSFYQGTAVNVIIYLKGLSHQSVGGFLPVFIVQDWKKYNICTSTGFLNFYEAPSIV